jgi:SH3 domain protein
MLLTVIRNQIVIEFSTSTYEARAVLRNSNTDRFYFFASGGRRNAADNSRLVFSCLFLGILLMLSGGAADAQVAERWVTDNLEITMRTDKNNRAKIVRMLRSGTRLEVLETDKAAGYTRVRIPSGPGGWVLSRYLLNSPPARVTQPDLQSRLKQSDAGRQELEKQGRTLQQERDELQRHINKLESTSKGLESDLDNIRRTASSAIQIDAENKELRQRLAESERSVAELEDENRRLSGRSSREWFIVGAGVVIFGMLLGLILPRIRWRRKSSWGDL